MTDKCKVSIVVPDYETTPGGNESKDIVAPFEGRITDIHLWDEKDKDAKLIFFESEMFDLYIHLWNALKAGRIWSFNIRIVDEYDEKPAERKEEEAKGWKELMQDNLHPVVTNAEGEDLVFIRYEEGRLFTIEKEAWQRFECLGDTRVDEILRELGVDPEKGWR